MRRNDNASRFLIAFVFGLVIIFPLMNNSGVITWYEAIGGIWLLFLIPAYMFYLRTKRMSGKSPSLKVTIAIYVLVSSLYSFIEPVLAGYSLGLFKFVIPLLVTLTLFVPSIYLRSRVYNKIQDSMMSSDSKFTNNLKRTLSGIDDNPPEVFVNEQPLKMGAAFVTHTDGKNGRIMIHSEALGIFTESEIDSAVLKAYFDLKNRGGLKTLYRINALVVAFVDCLVILAIIFPYINSQILQVVSLSCMVVITFGFIIGFPRALRMLVFKQESTSDSASVRISGDSESLVSYISKSTENYRSSPFITSKRLERVIKYREKQSELRRKRLGK